MKSRYAANLMSKFARPEVLYAASLFHDIAKGRGGNHSQLGKQDARAFCTQRQLSRDDSDLVVWLIKQHLSLSATAQKQEVYCMDQRGTVRAHL